MKNKLMDSIFAVVFGLTLVLSLIHPAHAGSAVISPKATYVEAYTATASTVTVTPGAVYEINFTTGAASEYVVLFDTNTGTTAYGTGGTAVTANTINSISGFKGRYFYPSTTIGGQIRFDPPLEFYYGIQMIDSGTAGAATLTYEEGRGLSGQ